MKYTYLLALAGAAAVASTGFSQTSVPITNNSFETPSETTGTHTYLQGAGPSTFVTGWTTTTSTGTGVWSIRNDSAMTGKDGANYIEDFSLPGNYDVHGGSIYQVLSTSFVAGDTYSLTALAGDQTSGVPVGDTFFIANSTGTVLASTTITGQPTGSFATFTVPFTSTGLLGDTGAIEIGFADPGQTVQANMEIDDFVLTATAPVPEPSSIAIAALGGFGLLGLVRRRRA